MDEKFFAFLVRSKTFLPRKQEESRMIVRAHMSSNTRTIQIQGAVNHVAYMFYNGLIQVPPLPANVMLTRMSGLVWILVVAEILHVNKR